jgi:hypothetical protein
VVHQILASLCVDLDAVMPQDGWSSHFTVMAVNNLIGIDPWLIFPQAVAV